MINYDRLNTATYKIQPYQMVDLGEYIAMIEKVIDDYW